ncbi:MAG: domain S-box-containing protein [Verrucomicrobiales bacterium]|nr:domain S-box-containing protein [Verrucomicrobiales bacterium]
MIRALIVDARWNRMQDLRAITRCLPCRAGWLAFLMLLLFSLDTGAQTSVDTPRTIRVVMDNAYAPYSFQSDEGKLQGILIDQWRAWEKKTGIKVEIHAMDWAEALRLMRAGEFDVIESIVETEERRGYFDFTPAYTTVEVPIFFRRDISGINVVASLKEFPVGVKAGDQHIEKLREQGVVNLIPFQNNVAIIGAAKQHKINVFVADAPSVLCLLHKAGIEGEFRQSAPIFRDGLHRAVRKGNEALLRSIVEGFAAIDPGEMKQINEKWFGRTINWYRRYFIYAGYAAGVTLLLIAGLVGWNRTLKTKVLERTAELSESEQRFRQIAISIHQVFWLIDPVKKTLLYVSPAYQDIWGRTCASLHAAPLSWLDQLHSDDRERVRQAVMTRQATGGFDEVYRIVRPDNSIRWIHAQSFPVRNAAGEVYRIAGLAEDITERKKVEESLEQSERELRERDKLYRLLVDNTNDFIRVHDSETRSIYGSPSVVRLYGREPKSVFEFAHPEDLERCWQWWRRVLAGDRTPIVMRVSSKDGRWHWVETQPSLVEYQGLPHVMTVCRDVTERKEAEEALARSEQQLHALVVRLHTVREEEAKRIARELHDDLGQKLTALNMELADLELKLANATPSQRARFAGMHTTIDQTIAAVQEISTELRLGQLDVLGLTAAIEWQLIEFSRRYGIPCKVVRLDEITDLSDAQRTAVFRILQEALTNIVRHAGATEVEISLQAGSNQLALKVHDNGRGITAAELNDRSAIGLLGMRERAQNVSGDVTITGVVGEGTTVLVTIPLLQTVAQCA